MSLYGTITSPLQEKGCTFHKLLKSEMHDATVCERYGVILSAYVRACGAERRLSMDEEHRLVQVSAVTREAAVPRAWLCARK